MSVPKSILGAVLGAAYLLMATLVAIVDMRSDGGFFNLRGLATYFITFPASFVFFKALSILGIDDSRFSIPLRYSPTTVIMISIFIGICTAIVYSIGAAITFGIRKFIVARR